jgi:hypothetical protein
VRCQWPLVAEIARSAANRVVHPLRACHKERSLDGSPFIPLVMIVMLLRIGAGALVAVLCYTNSLEGDFLFDDTSIIVDNKDVTDPKAPLSDLFNHDFWGQSLDRRSHKSYRPLTVLSFRANFMAVSTPFQPSPLRLNHHSP